MTELQHNLQKNWPLWLLVVTLIAACLIIFFVARQENNIDGIVETSFVPRNVSENQVISPINEVENIVPDDLLEKICALNIQDELEEAKKAYHFQVNSKQYDTRINAGTSCEASDVNCQDRSFSLNEEKIQKEIKESEYNLINACLYKDGLKALDSDLSLAYKTDLFGLDLSPKFERGLSPETWQAAFEWFRFENNNKLFVFLKNTAPCGGCVFIGHYLVIDLETEEILGGYQDGLYDYFSTVLSPDNKRAVVASWDNETFKTNLYVYDFRDFSTQLISSVPDDKSVLFVGYGTQLNDGVVTWLNNETIALQLFEKATEDDAINTIGGVKYEINQAGKKEAIKSGSVQEIKVSYDKF